MQHSIEQRRKKGLQMLNLCFTEVVKPDLNKFMIVNKALIFVLLRWECGEQALISQKTPHIHINTIIKEVMASFKCFTQGCK